MKKQLRKQFFYWSLTLVILTIPFPKYSLNSQSIILLVLSWLLYNTFKEKRDNIKKLIRPFLLISSMFWLNIFSISYSSNVDEAIKVVYRSLPFLILPLVLFSAIKDFNSLMNVLKIFSIGVISALLFGYAKAMYFKVYNLGDFFYYTNFAKVLGIHTTYFAMFVILSITFFVTDRFRQKSIPLYISIGSILFLLFALYTISARISLVALLVIGIILSIANHKKISSKKKWITLLSIVLVVTIFSISPNFQNRNSGTATFGTQTPELNTRLLHWKVVLHHIESNNWVTGSGYGAAYDTLYQEYLNVGFLEGFKREYNAHNQFLEITLRHGIIGIISLLSIFTYGLYKAIQSRDITSLLVIVIFLIFMLTESVLERHSGIVVFALFMSYCFIVLEHKVDQQELKTDVFR